MPMSSNEGDTMTVKKCNALTKHQFQFFSSIFLLPQFLTISIAVTSSYYKDIYILSKAFLFYFVSIWSHRKFTESSSLLATTSPF